MAASKHPSSLAFHRVLREIGELHDTKSADYGREHDPFAHVRDAAAFGVKPWIGTMLRASDDLRRIQGAACGEDITTGSLEKHLLALANYAVMSLVLLREDKPFPGLDEAVNEALRLEAVFRQAEVDPTPQMEATAPWLNGGWLPARQAAVADPLYPGRHD